MIYEEARILSQAEISPGIFDMQISCESAGEAQPGQFVDVYTNDSSKLLPRPISICDAGEGSLRLVYRVTKPGSGTEALSGYKAGEVIRITAPVGRGYPMDELLGRADSGDNIVLLGGGIGIPPMLYLSKKLGGRCTVVLGYRSSDTFLKEEFEDTGARVLIASDDGSVGTKGTVLDALIDSGIKADLYCACGPKPMLRSIKEHAKKTGVLAYISLEERMACGVGACLGCVTRTKEVDDHSQVKNARVCVDGPVFESGEVEL